MRRHGASYKTEMSMKTTVEADEELLKQAQALTGISLQQELVDLALKTLIQVQRRRQMLQLRGKVQWEGDLEAMRSA